MVAGWDQGTGTSLCGRLGKICENQGLGGAASPDQSIHLPNREIVSLVSKVMLIFGPFHLLDATAVSIPARGVIPLSSLGCKAA